MTKDERIEELERRLLKNEQMVELLTVSQKLFQDQIRLLQQSIELLKKAIEYDKR